MEDQSHIVATLEQNANIDPRVAKHVFSDFVKVQPPKTRWAALKRKAGSEVRGMQTKFPSSKRSAFSPPNRYQGV